MLSIKTIEDLTAVMQQYGINSKSQQAALIYTAYDIMKRVDQHFRRLGISPHNPNVKGGAFSGDLRRAIHWQVFNATGGDEEKLRFYSQNIQTFVELALQKNAPLSKGGMPAQISNPDYGGITVNRGRGFRRKAKPFLNGEINVHGRMLFDRLVRDYGYIGNVIMCAAVLPKMDANMENSVMKLSGWGATMDRMEYKLDDE